MKKVLIGILVGIILGALGYFGYDYFFKEEKEEQVVNEEQNETTESTMEIEEISTYNEYITSQFYGTLVTDFPLEKTETDPDVIIKRADIPKLLIDNEQAKALNEKMYNLHEETIDMIKNNNNGSDYSNVNIDYDFSILDNIIFIKINYTSNNSRGGNNIEYHGFYYDLENNQELTSEQVASKYNITVDKINSTLVSFGYDKTVFSLDSVAMIPNNSSINVVLVGNMDTPTIEVTIR